MRASLIVCLPLAFVLAAALATTACDKPKPEARQASETGGTGAPAAPPPASATGAIDRSHAGDPLPAMPFAAPGGAPATLGAYRGRPLLVNLWATWCGPCVRELPTLDALAAREKGRLGVVAISQDAGGDAQVQPFWKSRRFTALVPYTDAKNAVMTKLKVDVLPTTILYDSKGREVWRMVGDKDWAGGDVAALVGLDAG